MKVCLLNDSFPPVIDGVANVVMNYARILKEDQTDVMVATPRYPGADYSDYPYQVVPYRSFDTTKIVKGYRAGNPFDAREFGQMEAFAPDIIHSHCPVASTVLARMLRAKVDAPLIFTYHTKFDVDIARAVRARFIQKETVRALVNNIAACDEVWVVSEGAGQNLKSLGYEGDYRVVNNGVDFPRGKAEAAFTAEVTGEYDLPEGLPVFLFVGRMVNYKGLPLILDALAKLSAAGMKYRMVFVGSGPDEKLVKEKAEELGLMDSCIFTGAIHDREKLRAWNTRADLFLFPSVYDTNGIVVREAAACGLASVLIAGSCAAEGITHDRNGFVIEETADAMSELLQKICQDLEHIHQVGDHAMEEIYISWEDSVHAAYERYGEVIELKKAGQLNPRKRVLTDHFLEVASGMMVDTRKLMEQPRRVFEGMRDNIEELSEGLQDGLHDSLRRFW